MSTTNKTNAAAAQTALGKFYLHPWDSQVLVDWAKSLTQQGYEEEELVALSEMDGADREEILHQFDTVTIINNIDISFGELPAITAYLDDLKVRVLANEIDLDAAFAQVRPMAYDLEGIQLSGLSELDEDLNLLDSGEKAFHNEDLVAANRSLHIRTFFRDMKILPPLPDLNTIPRRDDGPRTFDDQLTGKLELLALIAIIGLIVLYVFLLFVGLRF